MLEEVRKLLQEDTDTQVISNCMSVLDKVSRLQREQLSSAVLDLQGKQRCRLGQPVSGSDGSAVISPASMYALQWCVQLLSCSRGRGDALAMPAYSV